MADLGRIEDPESCATRHRIAQIERSMPARSTELGLEERAMVRMVGAAEGDYRPWDEIEAWANEIATTLKAAALTVQPL